MAKQVEQGNDHLRTSAAWREGEVHVKDDVDIFNLT